MFEIDDVDKKFKILIVIVMILTVITFGLFMQDVQSKNINTNDKEKTEDKKEDKNNYRKIADVKYCEKINLKPYNETHCYS